MNPLGHRLSFHIPRQYGAVLARSPMALQGEPPARCRLPVLMSSMSRRHLATKVSALSLTSKKRHGHKITMVTAYDYPSAIHVTRAGIDVLLVGDSVAMVELGHETTQPMTVDAMIHHCQSVKRGVAFAAVTTEPLLVGDMPFGSYEFDDTDRALENAYRFVKEAGMDAVKVEVRTTRWILRCASVC
jgi:3-methyl-2-oxobutanoate hydroxymethyltransferase